MIEKIEQTALNILTEDKCITKHIQAVATDAVLYQQDSVQKLIGQHINSEPTQNFINQMAKEAYNQQAPASVDGFTDVAQEDEPVNKDVIDIP